MSKAEKAVDWPTVQALYGNGENLSVREIARRFDMSESTIRTRIGNDLKAGLPWPKDWLMAQISDAQMKARINLDILEYVKSLVVEERARHGRALPIDE